MQSGSKSSRLKPLLQDPPTPINEKGRLAPALSCCLAKRPQADSHHIQNASHRRPKKPASSTASIATSGAEAIVFPSSVTFTVPICRSEEHTSELPSLMRISYAVFCLKKKHNII